MTTTQAENSSTEPDFDGHLPAGRQMFTIKELADYWQLTPQHIINLVNEGRFNHGQAGPVDFSGTPGRTRATTRIPRACVLAFLQANKL